MRGDGMKIALTGGAGFIGSATARIATQRGHEVVSIDRAHGIDILDADRLAREVKGTDAVIHLAGMLGTSELLSYKKAVEAIKVNDLGTLNVLQAAVDADASYVGITMPESPWRNVYAATKGCAVHLAEAWHLEHGLPISHVRAFNAFGPSQAWGEDHPRKIIPDFAMRAWMGDPIEVWGDGKQTVDLVYVDDLARMLIEACAFGNGEVFDGGTGAALTVNLVAEIVAGVVLETTGRDVPIVHDEMRGGETPGTKIVARGQGWDLLGWHPVFDVECLTDTVNYYHDQAMHEMQQRKAVG